MSRDPTFNAVLSATHESVLDLAPQSIRQRRQHFVRQLLFVGASAIVVGDSEAAL
jgi:hypothetical protein